MKRFFTLFIIFCFFSHTISSPYTFFGFNQAIAASDKGTEAPEEEVDLSKIEDEFKYQGVGSSPGGDIGFIIIQQVLMMVLIFDISSRLITCAKPVNVEVKIKTGMTNFPKKCLGWSTGLEIIAGVAILTGEIVQSVKIQEVMKKKLGELTGDKSDEGSAESIVEKFLSGDESVDFVMSEVRDNLGKCDETTQTNDESEPVCEQQVKPLRLIRDIMQAQKEALDIKTATYTVALVSFLASTIIEGIAFSKKMVQKAAEKVAAATASAKAVAAASNPLSATVGAACGQAIGKWQIAQGTADTANETFENMPDEDTMALCIALNEIFKTEAAATAVAKEAVAICAPIAPELGFYQAYKDVERVSQFGEYGLIDCDKIEWHSKKNKIDDVINYVFSFFIMNAYARKKNIVDHLEAARIWSSIVGAGVGVGAAFALKKVWGKFFKKTIYTSRNRVIRGLIEIAISAMNVAVTAIDASKVKKNIDDLDVFLENMTSSLSSSNVIVNDRLVLEKEVGRDFESQFLQDFGDAFKDEATPCTFGGDGKGGCASASNFTGGLGEALGLNGIVAETTSNISKLGDELANKKTLSKNALKLGQKISSAKSKLEKIQKILFGKINELEVENGKKPTNFKKLAAQALRTIKQKFNEILQKNNVKAAVVDPTKKSKKDNEVLKQAKKKVAAAGKKDSSGKTTNASGFEFNFQQEKKSKDGIFTDDTIKEANVDKYSLSGADINKGAGKNIFKVISIRYFKSAYPVLVEEAK